MEKYASDSRTGVQKLVDTAKKRMDKLQKEMIRTENLKKYEKSTIHIHISVGSMR